MTQPSLFPVRRQLHAPYQPASATSKAGAKAVRTSLTGQCARLLDLYIREGSQSDWEAHVLLGWERTTVTARRHALMRRGQVEKVGTRTNPDSGIENTVYGLAYGWATR